MKLFRREFLQLIAGVAAAPATALRPAWAQETSRPVRVATGLLATWQSTAWIGAEAGLFKRRGIDMTLPAIAVGGPQAAAGVIRGDWEFAHTGTLPVAEEVLKGRDIVILATPTLEFSTNTSHLAASWRSSSAPSGEETLAVIERLLRFTARW